MAPGWPDPERWSALRDGSRCPVGWTGRAAAGGAEEFGRDSPDQPAPGVGGNGAQGHRGRSRHRASRKSTSPIS